MWSESLQMPFSVIFVDGLLNFCWLIIWHIKLASCQNFNNVKELHLENSEVRVDSHLHLRASRGFALLVPQIMTTSRIWCAPWETGAQAPSPSLTTSKYSRKFTQHTHVVVLRQNIISCHNIQTPRILANRNFLRFQWCQFPRICSDRHLHRISCLFLLRSFDLPCLQNIATCYERQKRITLGESLGYL